MWMGQALGVIKATQHRIDLNAGARPVRFAPRRAGHTAREAETAVVKRQLEADVIEPTSSEWGLSVVFVPKKDGTLRVCVDYRLLNVLTKKDSYPLPRMDECIDSLCEATIFSTLDCNAGYWQVAIAPEDREKTAFVCHEGAYQYKRMPFRPANARATFQRALEIIISWVKWQSCLIYLDDVIVYSRTEEEHIGHVDHVLRLLREAELTLRLPRVRFFRTTVEYLGHELKPGRHGAMKAHTRALREAHFPTTRKHVRSFVGMCNVFRRFVPNFARMAAPLTDLMGSTAPVLVHPATPLQQQAFNRLKEALTTRRSSHSRDAGAYMSSTWTRAKRRWAPPCSRSRTTTSSSPSRTSADGWPRTSSPKGSWKRSAWRSSGRPSNSAPTSRVTVSSWAPTTTVCGGSSALRVRGTPVWRGGTCA